MAISGTPSMSLDYWEAVLSSAVVPSTLEALPGRPFRGRFDSIVARDDLRINIAVGGPMLARRTAHHIESTDGRYLIALISSGGSAVVTSGAGHITPLLPGSIVLMDSDQPSTFRIDDYASQIVVQVPRELLCSRAGLDDNSFARLFAAPLVLPGTGADAVVRNYFRGLAALHPDQATELDALAIPAVDLLAALVSARSGFRVADRVPATDLRARILAHIRHHFTDPELGPYKIAAACSISRSTLYRLAEPEGGVTTILRRVRVDHARQWLIAQPHSTIATIAAACGFAGERQFYRIFRAETGSSPNEYRARHRGSR